MPNLALEILALALILISLVPGQLSRSLFKIRFSGLCCCRSVAGGFHDQLCVYARKLDREEDSRVEKRFDRLTAKSIFVYYTLIPLEKKTSLVPARRADP